MLLGGDSPHDVLCRSTRWRDNVSGAGRGESGSAIARTLVMGLARVDMRSLARDNSRQTMDRLPVYLDIMQRWMEPDRGRRAVVGVGDGWR